MGTFDPKNQANVQEGFNPTFKFVKTGDCFEGLYLGYRTVQLPDKDNPGQTREAIAYDFANGIVNETAKFPDPSQGEVCTIFGSADLNKKIPEVAKPGDWLGIRFDGLVKFTYGKGGHKNSYSLFPVPAKRDPNYARYLPGGKAYENPAATVEEDTVSASDLSKEEVPFLTEAEKLAKIVAIAKDRFKTTDDFQAQMEVMKATSMTMVPANYDAILTKLK